MTTVQIALRRLDPDLPLPRQADEFTCSKCFLVHHRSQLASEKNGVMVCRECAA